MPKLSPEQRKVIEAVRRAARRKNATHKEEKAAIETVLVESNARNLNYGDRDSVGAFQQRPSQGWGPAGESVEKDAAQFFNAAKKHRGSGGSSGQLAQRVQRSAFPERYDQKSREAMKILRSTKSRGGDSGEGRRGPRAATASIPGSSGVDNSAIRQQLVSSFLQNRGRPGAMLALATGIQASQDIPATPGSKISVPSAKANNPDMPNKRPSVNELFFDKGVNLDRGKPTKPIGGHGDHVHVAVNNKADLAPLKELARKMGLRAGGDKDKSGHTPGSFHYSGRAIDVSGDPKKMAEFNRRVAARLRKRR